jgi:hypothetical protein
MPEIKSKTLVRKALWIFCRAWLAGGLGLIATACGFAIYTSVWLYRSTPAHGSVVGLVKVEAQDGNGINYAPRFTFKAEDGRTYTVTSSLASNPPEFEIGQEVSVRYVETKPASATIDSFGQLWIFSIVFAGLGAFFTGAGYLLFRYERRSSRPSISH